MTENSIRLERFYPQEPAAVWQALTTPEKLARWWAPGDIAPAEGHRFTLDMGAWGSQQCVVRSVEPGTAISFLFSEGGLNTIISWRLEARDGGTVLRHEHAGFDLDSPLGQQAFNGMGQGWPTVLDRLGETLDQAG